jgi:hypothetical protein
MLRTESTGLNAAWHEKRYHKYAHMRVAAYLFNIILLPYTLAIICRSAMYSGMPVMERLEMMDGVTC